MDRKQIVLAIQIRMAIFVCEVATMAKTTKSRATVANEKSVGVNLELPESLHRQVKSIAAQCGMTIKQAAEQALRQWCKEVAS